MCDKKGYPSHKAAKKVIDFLKGKRGKHKIPKRDYWCEACREFHLTSRKFAKKHRLKTNRTFVLS